jgi:sterol 24-C-methyltransferase
MAILDIDLYRVKTRLRALLWLYTLDQRDIDAFMNAYILFDGDWSTNNGKREEHIVDYYKVLSHLCTLGNVEKMYIPPLLDPAAGVTGNQVLFERKMMRDIGVHAEARVLDIGCGRGRVASHVAAHTGARVTGLNIDPGQLDNARAFTNGNGLSRCCEFVLGTFNNPLPFPDGSFDAGYEIQAFTYAKDKDAVFAEVFRVMRPGAKFSYLDWVLLPAYDPKNPQHADLVNRTKPFIGAVDTVAAEEITGSMKKAGFEILLSENASIGGHQSALIMSERKYFGFLRKLVAIGVKSRLLPPHFPPLFNRLKKNADAFVAADQMGLATTSYQIVCQKPVDAT